MAAKILIKRIFSQGISEETTQAMNRLREAARKQPGYITGETLVSTTNPREFLVISTWNSLEDWQRWKNSPKRKQMEAGLALSIEGSTRYDEYVTT